jgi:hypothetical protein
MGPPNAKRRPGGGGAADAIGEIDAGEHKPIPPTSATARRIRQVPAAAPRAPIIGQPKLAVPS